MLNELEKVARVNADLLGSLGHRAARLYVEDRVPLNTSIFKMAKEHSLNSEHVKRVCEKANTAVDGALFDAFQKVARNQSADEKIFYPKFPAAEPKVVLAALGTVEKTASVSVHLDDYDRPTPENIRLGYDAETEVTLAKMASEQKDAVAVQPRVALEKLQFMREDLVYRKIASDLKIDDCAHDVYQHIKQQVLRGSSLKDLYKAALSKHSGDDKNRVKDLFQFAAGKLVDEGVVITNDRGPIKLAYAALTPSERNEWVSDLLEGPKGAEKVLTLNGSHVNDDHPMHSIIDIMVKQYDEADRYDKALTVVDDKIRYVKRKIHGESVGGA